MAEATDGAEHLLHRRCFADDLRGAGQAWGDIQALLLLSVLIGALDQRHRLIDVKRLGQVFKRATLIGRHRAIKV
ncbi:hypothetical protein D3C85_1848070 [compost metagenome]